MGARPGGASTVSWSSTPRVTSGITSTLGPFATDASVDFTILDGMPATHANVSLVLRYMGARVPAVTVLGHGVLTDVAGVTGGTGDDAYVQYTYVFGYESAGGMSVRLRSKGSDGNGGPPGSGLGQWALSKVVVSTNVFNYAPVASDRVVTVSPNAVDGSGTVELPATDEECDAVTVYITRLPSEGRLFLCSCSNIWTQAITPAMLPLDVPTTGGGACARVVYQPAANLPRTGDVATGEFFDSFRFGARDAKGAVSREATVSLAVAATTSAAPVSGDASLALRFDGAASVVTVAPAASLEDALASPQGFTVEARFRVQGGAAGGVLLQKSGAFHLGWTAARGLGFTMETEIDGVAMPAVRAHTLRRYDDGAWYHVAATHDGRRVTLYVDGALAAGPVDARGTLTRTVGTRAHH